MGRFIFAFVLAFLLLGGCKGEDKSDEKGEVKVEMPDEHCRGEALRNCQHRHPDWSSNPSVTALYNGCLAEIYKGCATP